MKRSRSNRKCDYEHEQLRTSKSHRRRGGGGRKRPAKVKEEMGMVVTTRYSILCHDLKAGRVIGKCGSVIESIRSHTGAWVNVHELVDGDEERIIEIVDRQRRDLDGRILWYSPAQEALLMVHDRILEFEDEIRSGNGGGGEEEEGGGRGRRKPVVTTRLVVPRINVGSLLGTGGKIIEKLRFETNTRIRVLPKDHPLPRCISKSDEVVQVVGDMKAVKSAVTIISSLLMESQHRDRIHPRGRLHSQDRLFPTDDDDFFSHISNMTHRSSMEGVNFGTLATVTSSSSRRSKECASCPPGFTTEPGVPLTSDDARLFYCEDLVFRILCPFEKVDSVIGESNGIIDLLHNEVGVDVKVDARVLGSNEQIIIISSDEGPDSELFPAQEALLHIQTRIVDLIPDEENFVTTRLLVPLKETECLGGRNGPLSEIMRSSGANIQILPREELPAHVSRTDEIVQITGEIKAARNALVEVTERLRSYVYRDFFQKDTPPHSLSTSGPVGSVIGVEVASPNDNISTYQNAQTEETIHREDVPNSLKGFPLTLVTRSTLEVVIPEHAASKLLTKSKNKLAKISEFSGAKVTLVEDGQEITQKIIRISGTKEQAEKAQSFLHGFILSTLEDCP